MTQTRATMRGIPGDSARKRGILKVFFPILTLGLSFGFSAGIIVGNLDLLPWWIGLCILLIALTCLVFFKKCHPSLVYGYFKGARGEEMVAGEFARLPATWTIFNGLLLPNGSDADHVAVGPNGIFLIETKHWLGDVALEDGKIIANGRTINKSPITQVRNLTDELATFLPQHAEHIHGVLCFAGPQFSSAPQHLDEVTICSYLDLSHMMTKEVPLWNAAEVASCVAQLGALPITKGL